jgi:hypothetical protein
MSKDKEGKKNNKKTALKTPKEKRAAKIAKRALKNSEGKIRLSGE